MFRLGVNIAPSFSSEELYPYESGNSKCDLKEVTNKPRATWTRGYETLPANDQDAIMRHLSEVGPLDVGIDSASTPSFRHYARGVFSDCNDSSVVINHAVQLVGYGNDEKKVFCSLDVHRALLINTLSIMVLL